MRAVVIEPGRPWPEIRDFEHASALRHLAGKDANYDRYGPYAMISTADITPNRILYGRLICGTIILTAPGGLGLVEAKELRDECAAWLQANKTFLVSCLNRKE